MKALVILVLLLPLFAQAQRGRNVLGPHTLGHPTAPTSGSLRSRSTDITGKDMSNTTMSSDVDPRVPSRNPKMRKSKKARNAASEEIGQGPYKDSARYFNEEGDDGKQAQEAAKEDSFGLSEKEIKKKQQGN